MIDYFDSFTNIIEKAERTVCELEELDTLYVEKALTHDRNHMGGDSTHACTHAQPA